MKKQKSKKDDNTVFILAVAFVIGGIFTIYSAKVIHDRYVTKRVIVITAPQN